MKLFKREGYNIEIDDEAYLLKPFKTLIDKDSSVDKNKALSELAYIYYYCDPRSDYQEFLDDDIKNENIKLALGLPKNWKPSKYVMAAMEFYNSFTPTAALLLKDTRIAVNKLRELLRNIDLTKEDDHGKPIYTLNTVTATIKQIPELVKSLDEAERTLDREISNEDKVRGSQSKSIYEDV